MSKTAFVLSGGNSKGAFQAGVMKKLGQRNIVPDFIVGTSVGAINGLLYSYDGSEKLEQYWKELEGPQEILFPVGFEWILGFPRLFFSDGLFSLDRLKNQLLEISEGKTPTCPVYSCYVSLTDGEVQYHLLEENNREVFINSVIASSSVPLFVESKNDCVDGGIREHTPIAKAIELGADVIHVVICRPFKLEPMKEKRKWFPWYSVLERSIDDIMSHEVFLNDIKLIQQHRNEIEFHVYLPDRIWLKSFEVNPELICKAFDAGMSTTEVDLDSLK